MLIVEGMAISVPLETLLLCELLIHDGKRTYLNKAYVHYFHKLFAHSPTVFLSFFAHFLISESHTSKMIFCKDYQ